MNDNCADGPWQPTIWDRLRRRAEQLKACNICSTMSSILFDERIKDTLYKNNAPQREEKKTQNFNYISLSTLSLPSNTVDWMNFVFHADNATLRTQTHSICALNARRVCKTVCKQRRSLFSRIDRSESRTIRIVSHISLLLFEHVIMELKKYFVVFAVTSDVSMNYGKENRSHHSQMPLECWRSNNCRQIPNSVDRHEIWGNASLVSINGWVQWLYVFNPFLFLSVNMDKTYQLI